MRVITVSELAGFTPRELMSLYFQVGNQLAGTEKGSSERHAVEQTLANIRFALARHHLTPH